MTAAGDGGFPSFFFDYMPTVSVSADYTDSDGVERYRSNDEGDFDVTVTDTEPGSQATKTGYVEWAGTRSDLETEDFDLMEGTGLCETQDVTGTEEGDYYRIVTALDDGTDFSLTSRDGLALGDTFDPIETSGLEVTQDDRTVSGSATTPDGALSFSFTC